LETNLRIFRESIDPHATLAAPRQIHGTAIASTRIAESSEADLVAGQDPDRLAAVRTADCVPILMGCRLRGEVVAIHAGWRGVVADAPGVAVRHLVAAGSQPHDIVAAIGPAIGPDAFEVGPEVAAAFRDAGLAEVVLDRSPRPHVDLHQAATRLLIDAGVDPAAIDGLPICTVADHRFFSHRRDRGRTGRHLSAIRCWHHSG
jgi:YfiH family protein